MLTSAKNEFKNRQKILKISKNSKITLKYNHSRQIKNSMNFTTLKKFKNIGTNAATLHLNVTSVRPPSQKCQTFLFDKRNVHPIYFHISWKKKIFERKKKVLRGPDSQPMSFLPSRLVSQVKKKKEKLSSTCVCVHIKYTPGNEMEG